MKSEIDLPEEIRASPIANKADWNLSSIEEYNPDPKTTFVNGVLTLNQDLHGNPGLFYSLISAPILFIGLYMESGLFNNMQSMPLLFVFALSLVLCANACLRLYRNSDSLSFDINNDVYYYGNDMDEYHNKDPELAGRISTIGGIQLLKGDVDNHNDKGCITEMNMVLSTGQRICLARHFNEPDILKQAQKIANILELPLWLYDSKK